MWAVRTSICVDQICISSCYSAYCAVCECGAHHTTQRLTWERNRVCKVFFSVTCSNLAIWSLPKKQLSGCDRLLVQLVPTWSKFLISCTAGPSVQEEPVPCSSNTAPQEPHIFLCYLAICYRPTAYCKCLIWYFRQLGLSFPGSRANKAERNWPVAYTIWKALFWRDWYKERNFSKDILPHSRDSNCGSSDYVLDTRFANKLSYYFTTNKPTCEHDGCSLF